MNCLANHVFGVTRLSETRFSPFRFAFIIPEASPCSGNVPATAVGGLGCQAANRVMRGPVQTAVRMVFLSSAAGWGLRVWIGLQ